MEWLGEGWEEVGGRGEEGREEGWEMEREPGCEVGGGGYDGVVV